MPVIWHISDLHFKSEDSTTAAAVDDKSRFPPAAIRRIVPDWPSVFLDVVTTYLKTPKALHPDAIVLSGDVTIQHAEAGFEKASEFLGKLLAIARLPARMAVVVPGNHDVDRAAFSIEGKADRTLRLFKSTFLAMGCTTPYSPEPFLRLPGLYVRPIDSCGFCGVPDYVRLHQAVDALQKEHIPPEQVARIMSRLQELFLEDAGLVDAHQIEVLLQDAAAHAEGSADESVRVAVLHHHLSSFPLPELKHYEPVVNAGYVKQKLSECGFDVVLHGHKHHGNLVFEQDLYVPKQKGVFYIGAPRLLDDTGKAAFVVARFDLPSDRRSVQVSLAHCNLQGPRRLDVLDITTAPVAASITASDSYFEDESAISGELYARALRASRIDILALRGRYLLTSDDRWFFKTFLARTERPWIRLLLLDTRTADATVLRFIERRARTQNEPLGQFVAEGPITLKYLQEMAYDTDTHGKACLKETVKVRLYDELPLWRMIRIDDVAFVNSLADEDRLSSSRGKHLPGYRVYNMGSEAHLFRGFLQTFERLWRKSEASTVELLRNHYFEIEEMKPAVDLLERSENPPEVKQHCVRTAERAIVIADMLLRRTPDLRIRSRALQQAALLHDIGRGCSNATVKTEKGEIDCHAIVGAQLVSDAGLREAAEIVRAHSLAGITPDEASKIGLPVTDGLLPVSLEAKILTVADKMEPGRETREKVISDFARSRQKELWYYQFCPGLKEATRHRFEGIFRELGELGLDFDSYSKYVAWEFPESY